MGEGHLRREGAVARNAFIKAVIVAAPTGPPQAFAVCRN
jgi:hypothetical protein